MDTELLMGNVPGRNLKFPKAQAVGLIALSKQITVSKVECGIGG